MGKIRKLRGGWGWGKMSPGWENRFFRLFQGLASGVVIVDTAFSVGFFCLLVCLSIEDFGFFAQSSFSVAAARVL
jgi:hypothetical protein